MVVVPALAGGEQCNPPIVPGIITGGKSARAPHVCNRVDQPGRVETDNDPEADAPEHVWNTADREKEESKDDQGNPMIGVQPDIEAIFGQVWRVLGHQWSIAVFALSDKKPAEVSPPAAITGRVRIAGLIGFLVMDSMGRNPEDRSALERQRATNGKEILKSQRDLIRPMRVQPMVAHADAKASSHPVEKNGGRTSIPAEHE